MGDGGGAAAWLRVARGQDVDVDAHFTPVVGGHRCRHCSMVVVLKQVRRQHMGCCKALPPHIREALDYAAVVASRATPYKWGIDHRSVFLRFHIVWNMRVMIIQ